MNTNDKYAIMWNWTYRGPLQEAYTYAVNLSRLTKTRMRVSRRRIGGVYLTDLDGTPVWDIVRVGSKREY